MEYSDISLTILTAKECGIFKSNAQFWKEFSDRRLLESLPNNPIFYEKREHLAYVLDSSDSDSGIVSVFDDKFPVINRRVKNNSEKPYLLFYKGNLSLLEDLNKNVAVIGLVDPTGDIEKRGSKIVEALVDNDLVIVSGLARGCDTIAHKACLAASGKTIAVLPNPINQVFPVENTALADRIVDNSGLLISEYYTAPKSKNDAVGRFIERDRLQAMFAKAIVLLASYRKGEGDSGSRHAMEAAAKYGIDRYVMYNPAIDENNERFGLNRDLLLSRDKASIITSKLIVDISMLTNHDISLGQEQFYQQQAFECF